MATTEKSFEVRARELQQAEYRRTGEPITLSQAMDLLMAAPKPPSDPRTAAFEKRVDALIEEHAKRGVRLTRSQACDLALEQIGRRLGAPSDHNVAVRK